MCLLISIEFAYDFVLAGVRVWNVAFIHTQDILFRSSFSSRATVCMNRRTFSQQCDVSWAIL